MGSEFESECPDCGATEFYHAANTSVHLGEKVKYRCVECEYAFVRIDGVVDTSRA